MCPSRKIPTHSNIMLNMSVTENKKKIAVGMSGGVDSSVAALLLKQQGHDVTGVYMQCWDNKKDSCAADENRVYAVQTAMALDIPLITLDFISEYKKKVIDYFYSEYEAGRTPNPDIMCNKEIKFGLFYDWAKENDFDGIATGHYAGIESVGGKLRLFMGEDDSKDQSYFLYRLDKSQLEYIIFPLSKMLKKDVRKIAENKKLPSAKRPESMGICFIGEVDTKEFISRRINSRAGKVLDKEGNEVGDHDGVWFFTVGQRHGFRLSKYFGEPMYVVSKDAETNTLVIGTQKDTLVKEFLVGDIHWVQEDPLLTVKIGDNVDLKARVRHLGKLLPCSFKKGCDGHLKVDLAEGAFGVAPGQSAVFYKDREVLGGGVIL